MKITKSCYTPCQLRVNRAAKNNRKGLGPTDIQSRIILVPRALITRGATRGSGQIHNRIPQKHGKKIMSGVRTSQSDASSDMDLARATRRTARKKGSGYENDHGCDVSSSIPDILALVSSSRSRYYIDFTDQHMHSTYQTKQERRFSHLQRSLVYKHIFHENNERISSYSLCNHPLELKGKERG